MRSLTELENLFYELGEVCSGCDGYSSDNVVAMYLKRLYVLCSLIYPEYMTKAPDIYLQEGQIMEHGAPVIDTGDMLIHYSAGDSDATEYLLCYYRNSPYWDVDFDHLAFSEYEDEANMPPAEFMQIHKGCFEQKLIDSFEEDESRNSPLWKFYDMFKDTDGCAADDTVTLASKLLPFYEKVKEEAMYTNKKLCVKIESAEKVLTRWLTGFTYSIKEAGLEKYYYISCDGSAYFYDGCYGAGVLEANLSILVAGEIIDRCIMELDKKMHFLPKEVKVPVHQKQREVIPA